MSFQPSSPRFNPGLLAGLFRPLLLVGFGLWGLSAFGSMMLEWSAAGYWPETPCHIDYHETTVILSRNGGAHYRPDIRFSYEFQGRAYASADVALKAGSTGQLENDYPAGSTARCLVDPRNPQHAVLTRGDPGATVPMVLLFAALTCGGLFLAYRVVRRNQGLRGLAPVRA